MLKYILAFIALVVTLSVSAAELNVALPEREGLVFDVPAGWRSQVNRPRANLPPTIVLGSSDPRGFQVLVTPIWPMGNVQAPSRSDIRSLVQGAADNARPKAVEKTLPLTELSGPGLFGYYFAATDRSPEPDGYKFLTQGAMAFGELRITFTVLANEGSKSASAAALSMLRSLRRSRAD